MVDATVDTTTTKYCKAKQINLELSKLLQTSGIIISTDNKLAFIASQANVRSSAQRVYCHLKPFLFH